MINRKERNTNIDYEMLFEEFKQTLENTSNEVIYGFVSRETYAIQAVDYARKKGFTSSYKKCQGKFKVSVLT